MTQAKPETAQVLPVPHVYHAINKVQAALAKEGISKDRKNEQQGFKFRGVDDVMNALSPLLAEYGLCILPRILSRSVTAHVTPKGGTLFYVVVEAEYDFIAVADGSKHTVRVYGEAMDSGDKATNKSTSAAYKYACLQAFSIPTEGENDADATTHEVAALQPGAQPALDRPQPLFTSEAALIGFQESVRQKFRAARTVAELEQALKDLDPQLAPLKASIIPEEIAVAAALKADVRDRRAELAKAPAPQPTVSDLLGADSIPY